MGEAYLDTSRQYKDSPETNEIHQFFDSSWPIKPGRSEDSEAIARQLREEIYDQRAQYPDLRNSFEEHGMNWKEVDWVELAECCLSDIYGKDWELTVTFSLHLGEFDAKSPQDVVQVLLKIAAEIEKDDETPIYGETDGVKWELKDID